MHRVSHDVGLAEQLPCLRRAPMSALAIQRAYLEAARAHVGPDPDPATGEVLDLWRETLDGLAEDPRLLADRLDWVAKLALLEGYRRRDGLDWSAARLSAIDLQYADVRPERGLAQRLEQRGSLRRLTTDAQVEVAVDRAPLDTRAWFRGECVRRFGNHVAAASWDSVIFDVPGRAALVRVPTSDPLRGTQAHVSALMDSVGGVGELVAALGGG